MASRESEVFQAIAAILAPAVSPSLAYITHILQGDRENVPQLAMPVAILEPEETDESTATTERRHHQIVRIGIFAVMSHADYDKQIVGDLSVKGIYDMVADIKNALDVYPTLNYDNTAPRVNRFTFPGTSYTREFFPFRVARILFEGHLVTAGPSR